MKAIFLDRDGVLNNLVQRDGGWYSPRSLLDFSLRADAPKVIAEFRRLNFELVVVTNQPDISRGTLSIQLLNQFHKELTNRLGPLTFLICPHTAEDLCNCRKPKPGLIIEAIEKLGIDTSQSWLIGDQVTDIHAGDAAELNTILLKSEATQCEYSKLTKVSRPTRLFLEAVSLSDCLNAVNNQQDLS